MAQKYNPNWRKGMLAKIHIAKKQMPDMDDDIYRAILEERYSKQSAGKLTMRELADFVRFLENKGAEFTSSAKRSKTPRKFFYEIPEGTAYAKQKRWIAAMWNALEWKMSGLDTRCLSQFGVEKFLWLNDQAQLQTIAKDLMGRCQTKGIDPYDAQSAN
jgi:phage gp16-like protein